MICHIPSRCIFVYNVSYVCLNFRVWVCGVDNGELNDAKCNFWLNCNFSFYNVSIKVLTCFFPSPNIRIICMGINRIVFMNDIIELWYIRDWYECINLFCLNIYLNVLFSWSCCSFKSIYSGDLIPNLWVIIIHNHLDQMSYELYYFYEL